MELKAIGLNIYGGGFTLGVSEHFDVVGQWEECLAGRRTWDMNFDELFMERPLRHQDWPLDRWRRKVQLVYANPPCAPWSSGNTTRRGSDRFNDPRLALSAHSMEAGLELRPEVFMCESVCNAFTIGIEYYNGWARKWMDEGYMVTYFLTDALLHGVPSTRQRFHFIAHRHELPLVEPDMKRFMPTTVRMAIGDLELDRAQWKLGAREGLTQHEIKAIPDDLRRAFEETYPGDCVAPVVQRLKDEGKYRGTLFSFLIRRAVWDAPMFTILYLSAMVHPNGTRWMTWREGLRLCGYPDTFRIHDPKEATQAVLPPIGAYLASVAKSSISERVSGQRGRSVRVLDWRRLAAPYRPGAVRELLRAE